MIKAMPRKFASLEAVRATAALFVVLFHTQIIFTPESGVAPFAGLFAGGSRGVDLFFVLSGFIIAFVHANDLGRPKRIGHYLHARFVRIYPSVWIVTLAALAVYLLGFGGAAKASKLSLGGLIDSFLLLPQARPALVNVTWSLKFEIFFYLIFSVLLLRKSLGIAVLAIWQACVLLVFIRGEPASWSWLAFYLRPITLEFGLGVVCAWLVLHRAHFRWLRIAAVQYALFCLGTAVFIAGCITAAYRPSWIAPLPDFLVFGGSAALIIAGLALLDSDGRIRTPKSLVHVGNASYSIYLVHFSTISLIAALLAKRSIVPTNDLIVLAVAGCGIAAGLVFHALVDQPLFGLLRGRKRRLCPAPESNAHVSLLPSAGSFQPVPGMAVVLTTQRAGTIVEECRDLHES